MKLSTRARYTLRMMIDVARHGGADNPVSLAAVAHRTDLSRGYLEQLVIGLRRARLLRGVAGRNGGYRLARPASEIRIGDVIEASIGPVCLVDCVLDPSICARAARCETRALYCLVNRRIADALADLTLADLLDPEWVALHGGFDPGAAASLPEGPDPCTASHGPRRGRPRGGKEKVDARRAR
jgi:Rrf2 family cysteine metabolism transcriptional repressor